MTLLLDPKAREAVIHGPPRILMEGAAQTVMANIARRVAEAPDGLIRSFQTDGTLRQETFAELWRRSGEIATRLRTLGVGPGSQDRLAAARPTRLRSLVLGVAARGRDPDSVHRRRPRRHEEELEDSCVAPGTSRAHRRFRRARPRQARGFAARCADLAPFVALERERSKTWIPTSSPILSVCSRPRARPGM